MTTTKKRKEPFGRPTKYTEQLAKDICDVVSVTYSSLERLCETEECKHWPCARTIYGWIRDKEDFLQMYTRAQRCRTEVQANYVLESLEDDSQDMIMGKHGLMPNSARVQRCNMRAAHMMKLMSIMNKDKYGDTKKTEITGANGGPVEYRENLTADERNRRIGALLDTARTRGTRPSSTDDGKTKFAAK
jgi:hypothetical protein